MLKKGVNKIKKTRHQCQFASLLDKIETNRFRLLKEGVNEINPSVKKGVNWIRKGSKTGVNPAEPPYYLQVWECPPRG